MSTPSIDNMAGMSRTHTHTHHKCVHPLPALAVQLWNDHFKATLTGVFLGRRHFYTTWFSSLEHLSALSQTIRHRGLHFHCYPDDTHLSLSLLPKTAPTMLLPPQSFVSCLLEIKTWTTNNLIKIYCRQHAELVVVAPSVLLKKVFEFHPPCGQLLHFLFPGGGTQAAVIRDSSIFSSSSI